MSLKNPVTLPGIYPGTVRLVAQCLNHYATPGTIYIYIYTHTHIHKVPLYIYIKWNLSSHQPIPCPCLKPHSFSQSSPILFFNFNLIASFHLCLCLPNGLSFMFSYQNPVCISLLPHTCPTCSPHLLSAVKYSKLDKSASFTFSVISLTGILVQFYY